MAENYVVTKENNIRYTFEADDTGLPDIRGIHPLLADIKNTGPAEGTSFNNNGNRSFTLQTAIEKINNTDVELASRDGNLADQYSIIGKLFPMTFHSLSALESAASYIKMRSKRITNKKSNIKKFICDRLFDNAAEISAYEHVIVFNADGIPVFRIPTFGSSSG